MGFRITDSRSTSIGVDRLDTSREEAIKYYLPRVIENPPDAFVGQLLPDKPTEKDARLWLSSQLDRVFPKAEDLAKAWSLNRPIRR